MFLLFSSAAVENDELVVLLFGRMDLTCCVVVAVVVVVSVVVALKWFLAVRTYLRNSNIATETDCKVFFSEIVIENKSHPYERN